MRKLFLILGVLFFQNINAQEISKKISDFADKNQGELINWRRHFHEFPELSNREFNTGKYIADYLTSLGLEVKYPIAKTGVVAILKGENLDLI